MKITIRKKHLKQALAVINKCSDRTQHCVVAQAVKQRFPLFYWCGVNYFRTKDQKNYSLPSPVRKIIRQFDKKNYEAVSQLLPVTFDARLKA